MADPLDQVSVEHDGRILTGVGVEASSLVDAVEGSTSGKASKAEPTVVTEGAAPDERPAPATPKAGETQEQADARARDEAGRFTADKGADQTKKPTKGRERFQELNAKATAEETRRVAAERRAEAAERELADLKRGATPATPKTPVTEATPAETPEAKAAREKAATKKVEPTRPRPSQDDIGEGKKYATYDDYVDDVADWRFEQKEAKLLQTFESSVNQRVEADQRTRDLASQITESVTRGRQAYQDFDAVIASSDQQFSPEQQMAILLTPDTEHVQYQIAKDPALAARIAAISDPFLLGVELGRLGLEGTRSPASRPARVVTSTAPRPPQPVGTSGKTATPSLDDLAADGDFDAYKARRQADRTAGAGRR